MPVFLRNFFKFLKPRNMKDWISGFPIINQFMIIFTGFIGLIILQVIFGSFFLVTLNVKTGYLNSQSNKDLRLLEHIDQELAEIQLLGGERYSQISNRSVDQLLSKLEKQLRQSRLSNKNSIIIKSNISKLAGAFSGTVSYQKYQIIRSEVRQLRALLLKQERLTHKSQRQNYHSNGFGIFLWLLIVLVGIGFIYWISVAIMIASEHHYTTKFFENITRRFSQGHLEKAIPEFPTTEFQQLRDILQSNFQRIRERFQSLHDYADEFPTIISDLVTAVKQNDEHCLNVKSGLRVIIENTYHSLDHFPEIAERIKNLNLSLSEPKNEFAALHQCFEKAGETFQNAPVEIEKISNQVDVRDEHTKGINQSLKELRIHIDNIQQIVTVFDSIAQQTTVLSLNASIEAARAGASGGGFDIAAAEIDILSDRIGVIPQDLLKTMAKVHKRMVDTIRANDLIIPQHKQNKKYFENVKGELNTFWNELNQILNELREYSKLVEEFDSRQKSLEQSTAFLAELNKQIPANYGRVNATLDVLGKSEELPASLEQITLLLEKLNSKLVGILS